ncbi:SPOR domain-containing protein [Elioraea sp.]|uniref:SPOR domain-containing protein n=1 Tax=Elioraea sp. TaxID=2185103 RepID=UPI0021DD798A|nr:SPOR domain-containing protein [Elioraea sp.]GIX11129.1 MAG: hypothetical protein KatS3mg116_2839 [Elioraea sp.]
MRAGDLDIPTARLGEPAWRQRDRRSRPRVLLAAAVVAALAFAGAATLVWTGERAREGEVPMIVADAGPFRVRPADPGGLQVPNQDQLVYQRMGGGDPEPRRRIEVLLPPPEAPMPVPRPAPPAEVAAEVAAEAAPAPEPPQPAAPAPVASAPAAPVASAPAAPSPQAAAAPSPQAAARLPLPPPPPQTAIDPAPRAEGGIQVQLAAVGSEAAVQAEWTRLRSRMPDLLADQTLTVSRGEREGQPFWRLRTGRFADPAVARGFCERVRARGFTCFVVGGS